MHPHAYLDLGCKVIHYIDLFFRNNPGDEFLVKDVTQDIDGLPGYTFVIQKGLLRLIPDKTEDIGTLFSQ